MEELIQHIGALNTMKKLEGDYMFFSTDQEFWKEQKVTTIADFERWQLLGDYETLYRAKGNKGFLPYDEDTITITELQERFDKLKAG